MAETDKLSQEIALEKRKQRAKERLNSMNSGDITRSLNSGVKDRTVVSDTYSTQKAKAKVNKKTDTNSIEGIASTVNPKSKTTQPKTNGATKSATKASVPVPNVTAETNQPVKRRSKKQIGNIVVDESALENISTITTDKRAKRNKVIIAILAVLIVLIWTAVLIMLLVKPKAEKHNCFIFFGGNAKKSCELLMNDQKITSWKAPDGIRQGSTYELDLDLKIKEAGNYSILFRIEIKNKDTVLKDVVQISPPAKEVEDGTGTKWYIYENIPGNRTIALVDLFIIQIDWTNDVLVDLDNDNATINFYVNVIS